MRARLKALKYVRRRIFSERIDVLLAEALFVRLPEIVLILIYLEKARMDLKPDVIREALHRAVPEQPKTLVCLSGPPFHEGHRRGEASALLSLLETRFGALTPAAREQTSAADLPTLTTWFERAIQSPDLESVFESVG